MPVEPPQWHVGCIGLLLHCCAQRLEVAMSDRQRLSLLAAILITAVSVPASSAQTADVMTPLPPVAVLAAADFEQVTPDASCLTRCGAARDRRIVQVKDRKYWSAFDGIECRPNADGPNCNAQWQECRDACRTIPCITACNQPFQSCCVAAEQVRVTRDYDTCVVQCPASKVPVTPPAPPPPPPQPKTGGEATGVGGANAATTFEAVLTGMFEVWMQIPTHSDVINLLTLRNGPMMDAFVMNLDGTITNNLGRTRPLPAFLEDRVQTGPPFAAIDDTSFTHAGIREVFPGASDLDLNILIGRLSLAVGMTNDPAAKQVLEQAKALQASMNKRAFTQYQAGGTCGAPERLEQVRRIRQSGRLSSTCMFTPNTSLRETLETVPSGSFNVGSSEHSSVRGTINGGGDFLDHIPEPPPDIRTPAVLVFAARRVLPQSMVPLTQLVMPGVVVTGLGGNADVVADLGLNGLEALVCLKGVARVRELVTNAERTVNAGEAVIIVPGRGISTPRRLNSDRLKSLTRPMMIGSSLLKPGAELHARPLLNGQLTIDARMVAGQPAGAAYALEVGVGNNWLVAPPVNKGERGQLADGRPFEYRDPTWNRWLVFASPNFNANNTTVGGRFQLMTDAGQAYRYVWDISPFAAPGTRTGLRIRNVHETLPMEVRVYR